MTSARNFDEGAALRINKQNGVGNYLPFSVVIFRRTGSHVCERCISTGSGLFALLSRDFEQILGKSSL